MPTMTLDELMKRYGQEPEAPDESATLRRTLTPEAPDESATPRRTLTFDELSEYAALPPQPEAAPGLEYPLLAAPKHLDPRERVAWREKHPQRATAMEKLQLMGEAYLKPKRFERREYWEPPVEIERKKNLAGIRAEMSQLEESHRTEQQTYLSQGLPIPENVTERIRTENNQAKQEEARYLSKWASLWRYMEKGLVEPVFGLGELAWTAVRGPKIEKPMEDREYLKQIGAAEPDKVLRTFRHLREDLQAGLKPAESIGEMVTQGLAQAPGMIAWIGKLSGVAKAAGLSPALANMSAFVAYGALADESGRTPRAMAKNAVIGWLFGGLGKIPGTGVKSVAARSAGAGSLGFIMAAMDSGEKPWDGQFWQPTAEKIASAITLIILHGMTEASIARRAMVRRRMENDIKQNAHKYAANALGLPEGVVRDAFPEIADAVRSRTPKQMGRLFAAAKESVGLSYKAFERAASSEAVRKEGYAGDISYYLRTFDKKLAEQVEKRAFDDWLWDLKSQMREPVSAAAEIALTQKPGLPSLRRPAGLIEESAERRATRQKLDDLAKQEVAALQARDEERARQIRTERRRLQEETARQELVEREAHARRLALQGAAERELTGQWGAVAEPMPPKPPEPPPKALVPPTSPEIVSPPKPPVPQPVIPPKIPSPPIAEELPRRPREAEEVAPFTEQARVPTLLEEFPVVGKRRAAELGAAEPGVEMLPPEERPPVSGEKKLAAPEKRIGERRERAVQAPKGIERRSEERRGLQERRSAGNALNRLEYLENLRLDMKPGLSQTEIKTTRDEIDGAITNLRVAVAEAEKLSDAELAGMSLDEVRTRAATFRTLPKPPPRPLSSDEADFFSGQIAPETRTELNARKYPVVDVDPKSIEVDENLVPSFKNNADPATGIVPGTALKSETYNRLGIAPVVIWVTKDKRWGVATGRHRVHLAKRLEVWIPAQIVREVDGWTREHVMILDAESNIRDGQGEVIDHAVFFRKVRYTRKEAEDRNLLRGSKPNSGWTLAEDAHKYLFEAYLGGSIPEETAIAIAKAAPNNEAVQAAMISAVDRTPTMSAQQAGMMAGRLSDIEPTETIGKVERGEQLDMLGFKEGVLRDQVRETEAAIGIMREIGGEAALLKQGRKVRPGTRAAEIAAKAGISVEDPKSVAKMAREVEAEHGRWKEYWKYPDLIEIARRRAFGEREAAPATTEEKEPTKGERLGRTLAGGEGQRLGPDILPRALEPPEEVSVIKAIQKVAAKDPILGEMLRGDVAKLRGLGWSDVEINTRLGTAEAIMAAAAESRKPLKAKPLPTPPEELPPIAPREEVPKPPAEPTGKPTALGEVLADYPGLAAAKPEAPIAERAVPAPAQRIPFDQWPAMALDVALKNLKWPETDIAKMPKAQKIANVEGHLTPKGRLTGKRLSGGEYWVDHDSFEWRAVNRAGKISKPRQAESLGAARKAAIAWAESGEAMEPKGFGERNRIVRKEDAREAAKSLLRKLAGETKALLDPSALNDAVKVGAYYIEAGAREFGAWSAKMVARLGAAIEPYLGQIWNASQRIFEQARKPGPVEPDTPEWMRPAITSIKNRIVDRELAEAGLPPATRGDSLTPESAWSTAETTWRFDPFAGQRLVQELLRDPRAPSGEGVALLTFERNRIKLERDAAQKDLEVKRVSGDQDAILEAEQRVARVQSDFETISNLTSLLGTLSSQSLAMRKIEINEDYSLAEMEYQARRVVGGKDLTPDQRGETETAQKRIEQTQEALGEHQARRVEKQRDAEVGEGFDKAIKEDRARQDRGEPAPKRPEWTGAPASDERISRYAKELQRYHIAQGIRDRDPLVRAVQADIDQIVPGISFRETADAMSGYGRFRPLSKDDISVIARDINGQLQQVSKLEDMAAGKAPKKTGWERRTPSEAERELIRLVNEAKKRGGYEVTDPETQLRSAMQAVQTRLSNEIADMDRAIKARTPLVRGRARLQYDAETQTLVERRNRKREEYDAIFGKPSRTLSVEQRTEAAIRAADRAAAEYEEMVRIGKVEPRRREALPETAELTSARAKRDVWREQVLALRELARPKTSPEERALQTYKARLRNRLVDLLDRMARGDFSKRERKPLEPDSETLRLQAEYELARRNWQTKLVEWQLSQEKWPKKTLRVFGEIVNLYRAVRASGEFSAVLRQGGLDFMAHPLQAMPRMKKMFAAFLSELNEAKIEAEIKSRENYSWYLRAGLEATVRTGRFFQMEEPYMSRWAKKVPIVAASERAYMTYLNLLRADRFDALVRGLPVGEKLTLERARQIARFVNEWTGRGTIRGMEGTLAGLAYPFFAPRLVLSRFQVLFLHPLWGADPVVRKLISREYVRTLIGLATIYATAKAMEQIADVSVGLNPFSSDFGKIRVGKTRMDPLAGLSQAIVLLSRFLVAKKKTATGKLIDLRAPAVKYGAPDVATELGRFLRTKLSPALGLAIDVRSGKNVIGQRMTWREILRAMPPMAYIDIWDAFRAEGLPTASGMAILAMFGIGLQTYTEQGRRTPYESLRRRRPPEAQEEFQFPRLERK